LQRKEIAYRPIEALGPEMRVGFRVDQLGGNTDLAARAANTPLQYIAHTELAADLFCLDMLVFKCECRITGDHEAPRDARQIGRQVLGDPVCEILLLRVVVEVGEGQHDD
jgi:hypothetical protein